MLDFAPLNKQSKLFKYQIHNPVRATFVPITHDKLKSVNWSHCCYMLITLAGKHAPLRTSQIAYFRSVLATNNKWH